MSATTPLRIYVAGLSHETNSFSPLPTSLRNFESDVCYHPGDDTGRGAALAFPGYGDAVAVARKQGFTVIEGPCFWTQPSGPVPHTLYERLRDEVLDGLRAAGPVDMILLNLHGAMAAQQVDDCEADLLAHVRELVGPTIPVGALLDLHGNVSPQMVESGAIIVGVKEYPHIDYRARTEELVTILVAMAKGEVKPHTTWRSIPVLSLQGTTEEPMRGLVNALSDYERQEGIVSVTLMHGFPWSDWKRTGASVLVIASREEGNPRAQAIAEEVAERFVAILASSPPARLDVAGSVDTALATLAGHGPVIIADSSDNPGGGAACDSTFLLRELYERGVERAVVGMIWDPQAAQIAADAGVGARMDLRVGGKVGPLSGDPIDLIDAEIVAVRNDIRQRVFSEVPSDPLGLAVRLRVGGLEVVINSIRQQVFSPECFTELGIDLAAQDIVVVKSSQHFRARFDPIARRTIYCNAPGSLSAMLADLPYRHLQLIPGADMFRIDRPVERCIAPAVPNTLGDPAMSVPVLPLSKARRAGNLLFVSGQLALRDGKIVGDGVAEQTDLVLNAIAEQLEAHGASMSAVVKTSVWLTRAEDFAAFNAAYARRFSDPYPARSTVISALALPGALVEIDAVADLA